MDTREAARRWAETWGRDWRELDSAPVVEQRDVWAVTDGRVVRPD